MIGKFATPLLILAILTAACGPNQRIVNSSVENERSSNATIGSTPVPGVNSFEHDLNAMRNADFNFIYVLRRPDGKALDADDKRFISETSPDEMNRRRLSDDGKAVIIGSNFRMPPENFEALKTRFAIEDHSKPPSELPSNAAKS